MQNKYLTSVANTWFEPTQSTHFLVPSNRNDFSVGEEISYRPLPIEANESQQLFGRLSFGKV